MRIVFLTACVLVLASCATYSDTTSSAQITENIHRVSMKGNALNEQSDAQEFALLKAAEVTLDSGKRYFVIINESDTTQSGVVTMPGSYSSNTTVTANTFGNYGYASGSTYGTYNPAQSYAFVKPGVDILIETYDAQPSGPHFDAEEITKYLGKKLNPKRWSPDS